MFNGDTLVSTIDQQFANGAATGTAQTSYVHADHLGSTNVVTNASDTVVQTLDYYPYGSPRIKSGTDVSQREYIKQMYDESTSLSYLNVRYYSGSGGQFMSEDPVHWAVGNPEQIRRLTGQDMQVYLSDPQQLNSYSYGRDNPINRSDPWGLFNIKTGAVENGDTLSAITLLLNKTYGTNYLVSTVATLNSIFNANKIYVGQTIIPNRKVPDILVSLSSLMKSNAATINSLPSAIQKSFFVGIVFPTVGPWDLKVNNPAYKSSTYKDGFVFFGEKVRSDAPGNINYGFAGKAAGFSDSTLIGGASTAQVGWDFVTKGQISSEDNSGDAAYIQQGIYLYNNQK